MANTTEDSYFTKKEGALQSLAQVCDVGKLCSKLGATKISCGHEPLDDYAWLSVCPLS